MGKVTEQMRKICRPWEVVVVWVEQPLARPAADGEDGDGDDEEQEGDEVQEDPRFEKALAVPDVGGRL